MLQLNIDILNGNKFQKFEAEALATQAHANN